MTSFGSNSMHPDMLKYASLLLRLFAAQDWITFEKVGLSDPEIFRFVSRSISGCAECRGMTLLHACVRYDPPTEMLDRMIKLDPRALRGRDSLGRTPLHVAAGSGADPAVVDVLSTYYPKACAIQDEDGRTPLHFACDASCELFEGGQCTPRGPPNLETVRSLLDGSLEAVNLEDDDERNAVEYAIMSDAPIEVIRLLQKASQRIMKKKTKMNVSTGTGTPSLAY